MAESDDTMSRLDRLEVSVLSRNRAMVQVSEIFAAAVVGAGDIVLVGVRHGEREGHPVASFHHDVRPLDVVPFCPFASD
jgi:hypothetical protein